MGSHMFPRSQHRSNEQMADFCNQVLADARSRVDKKTRVGRRLFYINSEQTRPILKATGLIRKAHPSGKGIDWWISEDGEVTAEQVANYRLLMRLGLDTKYLHDQKLCAVLRRYKDMRQDLTKGVQDLIKKL